MKVKEKYFENVLLPEFIIVGAVVAINLNNGRYALHRVTDIYPWTLGAETCRATVMTTELDKNFNPVMTQDGLFIKEKTWSEKDLIAAMSLTWTEVDATGLWLSVRHTTNWEHDVIPTFVLSYHTHLN